MKHQAKTLRKCVLRVAAKRKMPKEDGTAKIQKIVQSIKTKYKQRKKRIIKKKVDPNFKYF